MKIKSWGGSNILNVGDMEIWDGDDLSLLRETMTRLVDEENCRSLGVDMSHVKYVPSGFFGSLFDLYEKGVCIRIFGPLGPVKRMLWFTKFFLDIGHGFYELRPDLVSEAEERDAERIPIQGPEISSNSSSPEPSCTNTKCPPVAGILAK